MKFQTCLRSGLLSCVLAFSACGRKGESVEATQGGGDAAAVAGTTDQQGSQAAADGLAAARAALTSGQVDDAAARLTRLQAEGATFNTQQARDYRTVLSEAYDKAIEGTQRGDPKAQAALQLLRAAAPR